MNLFTRMRTARRGSTSRHSPQALPLQLIKFHLLEAQRLFGVEDYSQALFHCEEALFQDPTNLEASRMHGFIRQVWTDYIDLTPGSLFSFLWRPKAGPIARRKKALFGAPLSRFFERLTPAY